MTRSDDHADRDERLARYLAGDLDASGRRDVDEEILTDDAMAEAAYAALNLESALEEAGRARSSAPEATTPTRAWWRVQGWRTLLPLGAAVAAMLLLIPRMEPGGDGVPSTMRGDGAAGIQLLEPAPDGGPVGPTRFRWEAVEGASYYRVEILDDAGRLVTEEVVTEPRLDLTPDSPRPTLARGYWRVTAVDGRGRDLRGSSLTRFGGPAPDAR